MTHQDFTQICKANGFVKKKRFFIRKYGDNILQVIFVGKDSRHGVDLSFGAWSLYGELSEAWFTLSGNFCQFDVERLFMNNKESTVEYIGLQPIKVYKPMMVSIEDKFDAMVEKGIPILNRMTTQENFIREFEGLEHIKRLTIPIGYTELCGPYLCVNEKRKAIERLDRILGDDMVSLYSEFYKVAQSEDDSTAALRMIKKYVVPRQSLVRLWILIVCGKQEDIYSYIDDNLKRNMQYLTGLGL